MKLILTFLMLLLFSHTSSAEDIVNLTIPESAEVGQPFLLEFTVKASVEHVKILWQGKEAKLNDGNERYRVLLGTDLKYARAGECPLIISYKANGIEYHLKHMLKLRAHKYPAEKLKVAPEQLNPPKALAERIHREAGLGRSAMQSNSEGTAPALPLVRPVPGDFSSVYGKSRYFNGVFKGRHGGVDMRAKSGTPVKAAADGTVVLTGDFYFAGKCVYIDHGAGIVSFYGHMSKILSKKGQMVTAGEIIGLSGQTGRVTGPHLHFGMAWRGSFFDPAPLLQQ